MIKSILRFILGTYTVSVFGYTEIFLNNLHRSDVNMWGLHKKDRDCISFSVYKSKFKKMIPIAQQSGAEIQIIKKHGLPHLLRNYKKRYGIFIGAVLFTLALYISSLFIWKIDITGCESVTEQEVLMRLSDNGFGTGMLKSGFDIKNIENMFLKDYDKISWISINIKGTVAYVEVKEIPREVELIDTDEPSNIYASRDGVIASVKAYMGYSVVKKGDTVTAGDLIVTGEYVDKYGVEYKLHSYAKVMAYTVHSHSVTVPYNATEHIRTGKIKNKYSLKLIRFVIPLYFKENILYNNYDITKSEKQIKLADNFALPFAILKTTYTETESMEYIKSKETALMDAYEQIHDFENDLFGIVILDRKYEECADENGVTVKVMLECYEDIGISAKIN